MILEKQAEDTHCGCRPDQNGVEVHPPRLLWVGAIGAAPSDLLIRPPV